MNRNNLIFSSKINPELEDNCFDFLYNHVEDWDVEKIYVQNVIIAPDEILFFSEIDDSETIIRVPVLID
jgi:hypothetical protein